MTYEKDIPDFAMVPAREIEEKVIVPVGGSAVYKPVQVTNITEKPKTVITIEEDILVPDTKPDLREILLIDGSVRLASREIDRINKADDYIGLSGEVELQTLYVPENRQVAGPVIARYTTETYIYNQTLFVRLSNPALRADLSMQRQVLVQRLNDAVGERVIIDIRFS